MEALSPFATVKLLLFVKELLQINFLNTASMSANWWANILVTAVGCIIGIIACIIHSKLTISDIKNNPSSTLYKLVFLAILASLYGYTLTMLILLIPYFPNMGQYCSVSLKTITSTWLAAKMFMYLAFITRLCLVYNNPIYGYNVNILKIISGLVVIFALILSVFTTLTLNVTPVHDDERPFENTVSSCDTEIKPIIGILIGLYDLIFSIGSMYLFINPLRKTIKSISSMRRGGVATMDQRNKLEQLMQVGRKYMVLTCTASLSTILLMVVVVLADGIVSASQIDYIVNMACLMLMTPYYNKDEYYDKICFLTIKCSNLCLKCCFGYTTAPKLEAKLAKEIECGVVDTKSTLDMVNSTSSANTAATSVGSELHSQDIKSLPSMNPDVDTGYV